MNTENEKRKQLVDTLQKAINFLIDAHHVVRRRDYKTFDPDCIMANIHMYVNDIQDAINEIQWNKTKNK